MHDPELRGLREKEKIIEGLKWRRGAVICHRILSMAVGLCTGGGQGLRQRGTGRCKGQGLGGRERGGPLTKRRRGVRVCEGRGRFG